MDGVGLLHKVHRVEESSLLLEQKKARKPRLRMRGEKCRIGDGCNAWSTKIDR